MHSRVRRVCCGGSIPQVVTSTEYVYSKALGNKLLALYINGGLSREYVYVGGTLIATRLSNGVIQYHHSDHLSVRVTSDGSGSVIGYQGHYPFGESWYGNNAPFYNYRFTSYGWDSNVSQLYYASNRSYNYQIGRFQTPDLLDLTSTCSGPGVGHRLLNPSPQEANLYPYVNNDPTNRVDPLGLFGPECTPWPTFPPTDEPPFPIPGFTPPPTLPGPGPIPTFCPLDPFEGLGPLGLLPFPTDWFSVGETSCDCVGGLPIRSGGEITSCGYSCSCTVSSSVAALVNLPFWRIVAQHVRQYHTRPTSCPADARITAHYIRAGVPGQLSILVLWGKTVDWVSRADGK